MYRNSPVPKNTVAKIYTLIMLIGGLVLFVSANYIEYIFPWLVQCFGVILIGAAIYIASVYLLKRYTFSVEDFEREDEDGDISRSFRFRISEMKGNRNITVCLIEMGDIKACRTVDPENRKKVREERRGKNKYSYDTAFAAPRQLELQIKLDGEDISMLITYDPELIGVMNKLGVRIE